MPGSVSSLVQCWTVTTHHTCLAKLNIKGDSSPLDSERWSLACGWLSYVKISITFFSIWVAGETVSIIFRFGNWCIKVCIQGQFPQIMVALVVSVTDNVRLSDLIPKVKTRMCIITFSVTILSASVLTFCSLCECDWQLLALVKAVLVYSL